MQNLPLEGQQQLQTLCDILIKCYIDESITEDQAHQRIEELNKQIQRE